MIKVSVPATTANLGPGFDTLGMALNLYNEIYMELRPSDLIIEVDGEGIESIPRDDQNIVYRAAHKAFNKARFKYAGLYIKLVNRIPVARGLGSSAAAIIGGLVAANHLAGNPLCKDQILELATEMEGHPDNVAPALFGGVVVSSSYNGQVKWLKFDPPKKVDAVVAVPAFHLSTEKARSVLPDVYSRNDVVFNISRSCLLVTALSQGRLDMLSEAMQDRLHEPYRSQLIPGMSKVLAGALDAGALACALSGAGPTLIAFAQENLEQIGERMKLEFAKAHVECEILKLSTDCQGATITVNP